MLRMAMASKAIEMRSPAVSSMSSSRGAGIGVTSCARSSSSSVVSPMAETATTTSLPPLRVSTIRFATRLMLSALATDDPPNFCTIKATDTPGVGGCQSRKPHSNQRDVPALEYDGGRRHRSGDHASPFESATEGDLVCVLEVSADREARGETGDPDLQGGQQPAQIGGGRFALEVGVGRDDHFLY